MKFQFFFSLLVALMVAACASQTQSLASPTFIPPANLVPTATISKQSTPTVAASISKPLGPTLPPVAATRSSGSSGSNVSSLNLKGQFVYASDDGTLWIENVRDGNRRALFKPTSKEYPGFPSFSRDGKQVAYSVNSFTKDGQSKKDVRIIDVDGTNEKVILSSDDPKVGLNFPVWSPDDKEILFTHTLFVPPSGEHDEIDRVSTKGGAVTQVLDDSVEANISPDGKKMSFQRVDPKTFSGSLWIANLDGSGAKQIMETGTFASIFGARFSPDSQMLVFAGSGPPTKKLPGVSQLERAPTQGCYFSILSTCLVETAQAHGLPWDLWLVNLDGTKFERLTNIGADSPVPAWSQDGKYIAYFEATGIHVIDRADKKIYPVSDRGGYGGFDWR